MIVDLCKIMSAVWRDHGSGEPRFWLQAVADYRGRAAHTDHRSLTEAERLDALIDAIYYCCDSLVRGWSWVGNGPACVEGGSAKEVHLAVNMVGEFVRGAFGTEVRSEKGPGLNFVLAMVASELLELSNCAPAQAEEFMLLQLSQPGEWPVVGHDGKTVDLWDLTVALYEATEVAWPGLFWRAFNIVHGANLSKGVQTMMPDGTLVRIYETKEVAGALKIIKPKGWIAPDLEVLF